MAQQVIDYDDAIDDLTLELEERCLSIIALQQPIMSDLRKPHSPQNSYRSEAVSG